MSGFSGAARTHYRYRLALRDGQAHAVQNRAAFVVRESYVLEIDALFELLDYDRVRAFH